MALITAFHPSTKDAVRIHGTTDCQWSAFGAAEQRVVQLDTIGSLERKIPGKVSQSIQLDERSAEALIRILLAEFPGLRDKIAR
jgi:hypothetical protein